MVFSLLRVSRPAGIHGENIVDMVPVTNPFLRDMLETFLNLSGRKGKIDFDELGIQEVTSLLNSRNTHLDAVLRDFDNRNPQEDPVIHFYELFLAEYDRKKKIQRGVFYTPKPVVSYIVRSVHELLQSEFKLEHGLADTTTWGEMVRKTPGLKLPNISGDPDRYQPISESEPFVQILDPAVGTATFLVEVIDVIYRHLKTKWDRGGFKEMPELPATSFPRQPADFSEYWNQYVALSLLPRLHGFELMMAPYAIAHMKIGLKLWETGYRFAADERAHIYLTNSLEPPSDIQRDLPTLSPALAHEAQAVNEVKRKKRFTVVIGNPPYANFGQLNRIPFILQLLNDYKQGLNEKKINLDDDFIKFIRLSQYLLGQTGTGVFGMITNNTYLDGVTHRQMRSVILESFNIVRILNLHGSSMRSDVSPDGSVDENVFDIKQGVGISMFSNARIESGDHRIEYADLWGSRTAKYEALLTKSVRSVKPLPIAAVKPYFFFVPKDSVNEEEYNAYRSLRECFVTFQNGIKTDRDDLFVAFTAPDLKARIETFFSAAGIQSPFKEEFRIQNSSSYDILARRRNSKFDIKCIHQCVYRVLDTRWLYYSRNITSRPASDVMQHMLHPNRCLLVSKQQARTGFQHVFCAGGISDHSVLSLTSREITSVFPLYLYTPDPFSFDVTRHKSGVQSSLQRRPNFAAGFLHALSRQLRLSQEGEFGLPRTISPETVFSYFYAVLHSPSYRSRYAEFLKIDFPRLPLTGNLELFRALATLGGELVALHLLESPKLGKLMTEFIGDGKKDVVKGYPDYVDKTVWINDNQGFKGVPEPIWNFHVGGYQVCQKWLKDRRGRTLSKTDITHYQKIVVALSETIRLMKEIDKLIEKHGGWPAAFTTAPAARR